MRLRSRVLWIGLLLSLIPAVQADPEEPYLGLGYGVINDHQFGQQTTQRMGLVMARFGDDLSPYYGVEAHVATGADNAKISAGGLSESLHLYSMANFFFKPQIKFHSFSLYGLAGVGMWRTALTGPNLRLWNTDHGGAFGAGIRLPFTTSGRWVFDASYVQMKNSQGYAVAGVDFRFP